MVKDLEVNEGLFFLEILFNLLEDCTFDKDIEKELDKLRRMIENKLYSHFDFGNKDIKYYDLFIRYHFDD